MLAIDLYFVMNMAYDMILLAVTGMAAGKKLFLKKVIISAIIGSLWSCFALMCAFYRLMTGAGILVIKLITYIVCPYFMCTVAYKNEKTMPDTLIHFYFVSALIGMLMYWQKSMKLSIPSWISMPICACTALCIWRRLQNRCKSKNQIYDVLICYHGKQVRAKALYDSGNTLTTWKQEPVHVLGPEIWTKLIGEERWKEQSAVISFRTIHENSIMPGIYIDSMYIMKENEEVLKKLEHVMAGLSEMCIGKEYEYQMLLNRDIFT